MKHLTFLIVLSLFIASCNTDESEKIEEFLPNPFLGKWLLIEVLSDPGDGSGKFEPVESDKSLTFTSDLNYESFGFGCNSGTYSIARSSIYPSNCDNPVYDSLELFPTDDGALLIFYPCDEGCGEKYKKISDNN